MYILMCNTNAWLFDHRNSTWYLERLAVDYAVAKAHTCLLSLSE